MMRPLLVSSWWRTGGSLGGEEGLGVWRSGLGGAGGTCGAGGSGGRGLVSGGLLSAGFGLGRLGFGGLRGRCAGRRGGSGRGAGCAVSIRARPWGGDLAAGARGKGLGGGEDSPHATRSAEHAARRVAERSVFTGWLHEG
jgi:hypothetical protein